MGGVARWLFGGLDFDHDDVVGGGFGFVVEGALAEFAGGVLVALEHLLHEGGVGLGEIGELAFGGAPLGLGEDG